VKVEVNAKKLMRDLELRVAGPAVKQRARKALMTAAQEVYVKKVSAATPLSNAKSPWRGRPNPWAEDTKYGPVKGPLRSRVRYKALRRQGKIEVAAGKVYYDSYARVSFIRGSDPHRQPNNTRWPDHKGARPAKQIHGRNPFEEAAKSKKAFLGVFSREMRR
jgi:hypothetical protein